VASTALRISTQRTWLGPIRRIVRCGLPTWAIRSMRRTGFFKHGPDGLASRNLPHCMPLWRRRLHARVGEFDEQRYGPSADWALWLLAGCSGALFHFSSSPLGLYLRDEGSYWRKDRANRRFDERIVADFADVAVANGPLSARRPTRPRSLEISAALSLLRAGACFEGMARLLSAATPGPHRPYSETAQVLLDQVALQFLGCGDLRSMVTRHAHAECGGRDFDGVTFSALVDIVHQFDPTRLGQHATRARRNVELACVDLHGVSW
jgi:hypothetical protein